MGLLNFGLATIVVFKREMDDALQAALRRDGYALFRLPKNPYLPLPA
jgi:hypothetical protein